VVGPEVEVVLANFETLVLAFSDVSKQAEFRASSVAGIKPTSGGKRAQSRSHLFGGTVSEGRFIRPQGHQRADVHGTNAWVRSVVAAHVNMCGGGGNQSNASVHHGVRGTRKRVHGSVGIPAGVAVPQLHLGYVT
jgi:hypothetical protein